MKATCHKYILNFKRPSGTSRGVLNQKETWFIIIELDDKFGIGECGILRSLSIDDQPNYEEKLKWVCENIHLGKNVLYDQLIEYPSIQFGLEQETTPPGHGRSNRSIAILRFKTCFKIFFLFFGKSLNHEFLIYHDHMPHLDYSPA